MWSISESDTIWLFRKHLCILYLTQKLQNTYASLQDNKYEKHFFNWSVILSSSFGTFWSHLFSGNAFHCQKNKHSFFANVICQKSCNFQEKKSVPSIFLDELKKSLCCYTEGTLLSRAISRIFLFTNIQQKVRKI